ncbi:MAG TPA: 7TM diverse intracellular signaling domain-containing protein, partial [Bacteroidia bacterium]|nr:7TM diverse intracellular signaling domain-containing protein [Bacteroidia bacterium]
MKNIKQLFYLLFVLVFACKAISGNVVVFSETEQNNYIGKYVWILEDTSGKMNIHEARNSGKFKLSTADVPRFGFTSSAIWVKFQVKNPLPKKHLILELGAPLIDEAELYTLNDDSTFTSVTVGQNKPFYSRKYDSPTYLFDLYIEQGSTKTYFMKIKSYDQIEIPLKVISTMQTFSSVTTHNFMLGIYCGIMLIMVFYNLFIYFSIRDKSYLYYVAYILVVMLTQTTFQGYTFKYLWPSCPRFEVASILLMSILVGFASVEFLRVFLNTKQNTPKLDKVFLVAYFFYGIATMLVIMGIYQVGWVLILSIVSPLSMYMLFVAIRVAGMGYRPAVFFSVAWSIFLVGVFIYAMKDFGILPHNNFTVYTMPVGSAIETVLLSFALADRINILKKEKEESQAEVVLALQEKEKLIREQNTILEQSVNERTMELKEANKQLNETLTNLKDTQTQLIN